MARMTVTFTALPTYASTFCSCESSAHTASHHDSSALISHIRLSISLLNNNE